MLNCLYFAVCRYLLTSHYPSDCPPRPPLPSPSHFLSPFPQLLSLPSPLPSPTLILQNRIIIVEIITCHHSSLPPGAIASVAVGVIVGVVFLCLCVSLCGKVLCPQQAAKCPGGESLG